MNQDRAVNLKKFEKFLKNIDIEKYSHLRIIKTLEQDMSPNLLPLEIYYKYFWESDDYKEYDEIFRIYWNEKLPYIYEFIKKFFYGCSLQFVEEGFKARLYRIWISILTQFHFQYLWNKLFDEKLESNANLDGLGIDARFTKNGKIISIQIKKISYKREVSDRRFTSRQQKYADIVVEVPYLVIDTDELQDKIKNPRTRETTKEQCRKALDIFNTNFLKLQNGFVIFNEDYLNKVYQKIMDKTSEATKGNKITYDEIIEW
ncbi:Type II restriction enzyme TthHB8I (Endonuclease TthHB8I) (R.TthHB8I) (modular protein) [groundwater metagenome]|uniref:Type II restriction enzyme TthHB8I (Endonuclease TthHB8I) (R.TthHB8I) (Modular protein) n=1 Tax=groundwater metagenome TaxID=717931 RepID=A0A098E986_9ZZZZ